jgi:hypothetical protein
VAGGNPDFRYPLEDAALLRIAEYQVVAGHEHTNLLKTGAVKTGMQLSSHQGSISASSGSVRKIRSKPLAHLGPSPAGRESPSACWTEP